MIEDPKFTLEILEYFAQEEVPFPANISAEELQAVFPQRKQDEIIYHLVCCSENELLRLNLIDTQQSIGRGYLVDRIEGLTAKGGDYVKNSRGSYWEKAYDKIKDAGVDITTRNLIPVLENLIKQKLGL